MKKRLVLLTLTACALLALPSIASAVPYCIVVCDCEEPCDTVCQDAELTTCGDIPLCVDAEVCSGGGGGGAACGCSNPLLGTRFDDTLTGGAVDNCIDGGGGADTIYGLAGEDDLLGNSGDDTLYGGSGDDCLDGGSGSDNLRGDSGSDVCVNGESYTSCND